LGGFSSWVISLVELNLSDKGGCFEVLCFGKGSLLMRSWAVFRVVNVLFDADIFDKKQACL